jgi:hypothetical protein
MHLGDSFWRRTILNPSLAIYFLWGRHTNMYWGAKKISGTRLNCGELATPLMTVKPVGVYSTTLVQYLYISCYLSDNKPVLSYLLSRLLPHNDNFPCNSKYFAIIKLCFEVFHTLWKRTKRCEERGKKGQF